ncbi:uncharacterized protein LOC143242790 isoform X3 [Tachypleus tridentatus]|uniref:uncharacterized protein LOC143242790 isoform X3 n=1 Tax=Tachypleus tridentatus TaxID=6853 RepID=UPI003FD16B13
MAFKFNFPAPCRHVSDAEQDNCEEACEGRICTSEGKVPINRGGETVCFLILHWTEKLSAFYRKLKREYLVSRNRTVLRLDGFQLLFQM